MSEYKPDQSKTDDERTGGADLMKIVKSIGIIARKAENLVVGRDKLRHFLLNQGNGCWDEIRRVRALLRASQAARDAGLGEIDLHFLIICCIADNLAEKSLSENPTLRALFDEMNATLSEQGKMCDPEDPDTWTEEYLTITEEFYRRQDEAREQNFISLLRSYDEDETADLYLKNYSEYWKHFGAGLRILASRNPDGATPICEMLAKLDELKAEDQKAFMHLAAASVVGTPSTEVVSKT